MHVEQWERVKTLFEEALGLAPEERTAFLVDRGRGDQEVISAVLTLLRNHSESLVAAKPRYCPLIFEPGDLIGGRFRILRHVNSGGMGDVYEVFDERLSLRVALKTMRPELLASPDAIARFQREIRLARGVSHPNLCRLYEFLEHARPDGTPIPCLTMEFVEGETLSAYLQRFRPISVQDAMPILSQIAGGLDHLHSRGIIHRDLKPSNVMIQHLVDGRPRVVIMDFGLAKPAESSDDPFESSLHFQAGAPYYMSPEQLRGERPTASSDVYAFGLLIDEMVTSSPAFAGESMQALYYAKLWEQPIAPRSRARNLPAEWDAVIRRCLAQRPAERPGSAGQIVELLQHRRSWPVALVLAAAARLKAVRTRTYAAAAAIVVLALAACAAAPPVDLEVVEFANQTGDASYAYLCSGLTSEVARSFSAAGGVSSILVRRPKFGPLRLRGRFAMDGELRLTGGETAFSIALHDARNSRAALWSHRFTAAEIADPLRMEKLIVNGAASALAGTLSWQTVSLRVRRVPALGSLSHLLRPSSSTSAGLKDASPKNNRALDDFMRGRQMAEQMSPDKVTAGIALLERAVAEDPSFARGYTALANANFSLLNWSQGPPDRLLTNAKALAQTAVTLDPNLAEAYEARALVYQHEWDWTHAREDYLRALLLKPSFSLARRHYAVLLAQSGDLDEAVRQARQARQDDPYDESALPGFGLILYIAGRAAEAVDALRPVAAQGMSAACHNLGESYAVLGMHASGDARAEYFRKAISEAQHLRDIELRAAHGAGAPTPSSDRLLAEFYGLSGDHQSAQPYVARVRQELRQHLISAPEAAWVLAAAGQKSEALDLLEEALATKDRHLLFIKVYPFADSLRGEPRFRQILQRMQL